MIAGFAASWLDSEIDVYGGGPLAMTKINGDGAAVTGYLAGKWGPINSSLIYSYATMENTMVRNLGSRTATSTPESHSHIFDWQVGYSVNTGRLNHGPSLGVQWTAGELDGFTEASSAAGPMANNGLLTVGKQKFDSFRFEVGYGVSYELDTELGKLVPFFNANWIHEESNDDETTLKASGSPFYTLSQNLTLDPVGSFPTVSIPGGQAGHDFLNLNFGVDLITTKGLNITASVYTNVFRDNVSEKGFGLQVGKDF